MNVRKTVMTALLIALAMAFSYAETLIPYSFSVPGIKLGLPNAVIIFALYRLGFKESVMISVIRIGLTALLFTQLFSLIYSLSGAILSLLAMGLLKKSGKLHTAGVSVAGAVAHNIGQIIAAFFILKTTGIVFYLPMLIVSGVAGGVLIGLAGAVAIRRIPENLL